MLRNLSFSALLLSATVSTAQPVNSIPADPDRRIMALAEQARHFLDRQQADSAWQQAIKPGLPLLAQVTDTTLAERRFRLEMASVNMRRRLFWDVVTETNLLVRLCQQTHDQPMESRARRLLSRAYSDLGMYEECIIESLRILSLAQRPPDYDLLARTYTVLAWAYQQQGNKAQSDRYSWLGIQAGKSANTPVSRAVSFLNEGNMYAQAGQFGKAEKTIRTILPEIEKNPSLSAYLPDAYRSLAESLRMAGRLTDALLVADSTRAKIRQLDNKGAEIAMYITVAKAQGSLKNAKASLSAASRALALADNTVPPIARQEALSTLSKAQERVGSYAAALKTTRQLAALTDSLNRINRDEAIANAETRFGVKTKNETIGLLNKNMALRQQQARQAQQNAGILIGFLLTTALLIGFLWYRTHRAGQLTYRQKTEIEIQAQELAELNRIKDQLFSVVSHDLRGPVVSLQQGLEQFDPAAPDAMPRLRRSVRGLVGLIDNVLYWSLSQLGGVHSMPRPVSLCDTLSEVLALYEEPIRRKNLRLTGLPDFTQPHPPTALADETQTDIVIRNIVQNAIKFSPPGGQLTFALDRQPDAVILSVADQGPGFDYTAVRAGWQTGQRTSADSTGLGLQVADELMLRNGGLLEIMPRPDAPGTLVRLRWPAHLPTVASALMSIDPPGHTSPAAPAVPVQRLSETSRDSG